MLKKTKTLFVAAASAAALSAPVSAHASLFGSVFASAWAGIQEKIESTWEWMVLNSPTYFVWKTVTLPGGACGNGTPYRFFINQSPLAKNTVVYFEPGGACWDYNTCMGLVDRSAFNPNGIPRNYLSSLNIGTMLANIGVPLINRVGLDSPTPTRGADWNYVYMPYCTGDVHAGNNVKVYKKEPTNPNSAFRTQYFKGHINSFLTAQWLADQRNHLFLGPLSKPDHLFLTGQSAGAFGAPVNYSWFRSKLEPARAGLLSDAGWLPNIPSPRTSDSKFRGVVFRAVDEWNINGPSSLLARYEKDFGRTLVDRDNVGDFPLLLSAQWPKDRFMYTIAMGDQNTTSFANQALIGEPTWTPEQKTDYLELEIRKQAVRFDQLPNVGYYVPFARDLNESHCMTLMTFDGTRVISEHGPRYDSVNAAVLSALGRTAEPVRAIDASREVQRTVPGMLLQALEGK